MQRQTTQFAIQTRSAESSAARCASVVALNLVNLLVSLVLVLVLVIIIASGAA